MKQNQFYHLSLIQRYNGLSLRRKGGGEEEEEEVTASVAKEKVESHLCFLANACFFLRSSTRNSYSLRRLDLDDEDKDEEDYGWSRCSS